MDTKWVTFTKRTEDPKLSYLEKRLADVGIPCRRNGWSFHAPILEVPEERLDDAWVILQTPIDAHGCMLDDIDDDDPVFTES